MSKARKRYKHKVEHLKSRIRISDYCGKVFPILGSKSATKKAIAAGRLFLNGHPAQTADFLLNGDIIELQGTGVKAIKKLDIDLGAIYEDDHLIIINKPGGIAVNGNRYKTVENALAHHNRNNPLADALPRPVAVHRIDVPTCGLVLLAKTKTAQIKLGKAFQNNQIHKTYIAIVHGKMAAEGKLDSPVANKKATTHFRQLQVVPSRNFDNLSKVELHPITGRTHQLRIHLSEAGHCIVGDKLYLAEKKSILGKGVFLCACALNFIHPETGEQMNIKIAPPKKFDKLLEREGRRAERPKSTSRKPKGRGRFKSRR